MMKGAVIALWRRAATKVIFFQCGTRPTNRSPSGLRRIRSVIVGDTRYDSAAPS